MKKNKDHEIVPGVLQSVQSPSCTYEGPAQRRGSLQGIMREDGTQAGGTEKR